MDKKFFGIRVGTILTALVCIIVAFAIWMVVKYKTSVDSSEPCDVAYLAFETTERL